MGKGGGGSTQTESRTESNVVQTDLPAYAKPYFKDIMKRATAESKRKYQPYKKERIADVDKLTKEAQRKAVDVARGGTAGIDQAADITKNLAGAGYDVGQRRFDQGMAEMYMDPYVENVIQRGKKGMTEDFLRERERQAAQAIQSGAYGGSRAALMEAITAGQTMDRMLDFEAEQRQRAFQDAREAEMADRAFELESLGFTSQQAQQIAQLDEAARAGDIEAARLLESVGEARTAQEQAKLDLAYKDFLTQRDYGKEQLNFLNAVMRGIPVQSAGTQTTFTPYNPVQQALGTGLSALGLYKGLTQ